MNLSNPQTLFVRVIDDNTGCYSISELELYVSNTASNNTELVNCDTDGLEDGFFEFDLSQANSDVLIGAPVGSTIMYFESMNDALLEINALPLNYTNIQVYNQTIFARVENMDQCYSISEINLVINTLPDIETEETVYYCQNTYPETITINAGNIATPSNYTYAWSTNESTYEIEVNEIGVYSVVITNSITNCSKTRTVTLEPSNIATIVSIEILDTSDNNSITVITSGEGEYEYALFDEQGLVYPYQSNNIFNYIYPGIYTLSIRDIKNNCGIIKETISIIGFPKFFTPNGDGDNDNWNVRGISTIFQPNSKILIFDRYGKLIKQLDPLGVGWDGTKNGENLPVSDYWFVATLQDGRIVKDHFTLKR
jgi:gliding motility-associated-like protein